MWIFASERPVASGSIEFKGENYTELTFGNPEGGLFHFELNQLFPPISPTYSELEIEILDEHYDHLYSVYKDLWQELHPNEDDLLTTYSDTKMSFQVVLPESKKIHIRAFTGLGEPIIVNVYKKTGGYFYAKFFMWIFLVVTALMVLGSAKLGDPFTMIYYVRKSKGLRNNRMLKRCVLIAFVFIGLILTLCLTRTGYAHGGEDTTTPSFFYGTEGVNYLG